MAKMVYNGKNEKNTLQYLDYGKETETCKMRHKHSMTWNVGRKLNNVENETRKMYILEYGEKH